MSKMVSIVAAVALAGTTLVAAGSADARPGFHGYNGGYAYRGYRRGNGAVGAAVAAGAATAIIGGAIAANQYRNDPYYGRPAYGYYGGPAYAPGYGYGY